MVFLKLVEVEISFLLPLLYTEEEGLDQLEEPRDVVLRIPQCKMVITQATEQLIAFLVELLK